MDERSQSRWRDVLVRSVARRVKAWAEAVLAQEVRPSEPAPAPREAVRAAPPGGLPVQWLRDVQALRMGPPADWMERVRRGAPHLLARVERVPGPTPAPVPSRPAEPSWEDKLPKSRPRESADTESSRAGPRTPPKRPAAPSEPLRSAQPQAPVHAEVFKLRVIEQDSPTTPRVTPPAPVAHHGPELIQPPPRAEMFGPAEPRQAETFAPVPPRTPAPAESRSWHSSPPPEDSVERRAPPVASSPWGTAPAAKRSAAPELAPGEELSPLVPHPWPVLPEEPGQAPMPSPTVSSEASEPRRSGPWPDLPETPFTEAPDASALLLQRERLSRLGREQRGE